MKRCFRILTVVLAVLLLLISVPAFAATGKITSSTATSIFDAYNSTNGTWNELKTPRHRLNGTQIVYCLQHKKSSPSSETYNLTNLMGNYSVKAQTGLQIILENGYPWETGGLSAAQAEYATANAIRFWLSECGDSQFYNMTNLKSFSDAQLRSLAASGTITKKIRVRSKNTAYIPALQFSVELLIAARAQSAMPHDVTLGVSNVSTTRSGDSFVGSTSVAVDNLRGGYALDSSGLPAGSTVGGYTGGNGDTLTISIPASASTANKTYTLTVNGLDDRALKNMQAYNHNKNTSYQRVMVPYIGVSWYTEVVTRTFTVTTGSYIVPKPDLIVSSLTPVRSSYTTGQSVSVNAVVTNQGNAAAGGFYVSLSGGNGTQTSYISNLGAGASTTVSLSFTAPSSAQILTLTATADAYNHIDESNENNNTRTTTVSIAAPAYPDLTVTSVYPASTSYSSGSPVTIYSVIKNQGNTSAGAFVVRLTPEGMSSRTQTITGLAAGASQTLTWIFTAPILSVTADKTLTILADATGAITESNENNNTGTGSVRILGEKPDLTISSLTPDANRYSPGERITVTATVRNNGSIACPASKLRLTGDGISSQVKSVSTLAAGGTQTLSFSFDAPYIVGNKTFSITATADPDNLIAESNESNNSKSGSFTVSNLLPDLTITQIRADKSEYQENESGRVTVTVQNQGAQSVANSKLKLTLGSFYSEVKQTGSIAAGGSTQLTFSFTAPQTLDRLSVTATAIADPTNEIAESNEANNTLTATLAVKPILPDLGIISTNATNWYAGMDIVVTATVVNHTLRSVPAVTVRLTLAGNRYEESIPVPGNGSNLAVFRLTLPRTTGRTTLNFTVDPAGAILEQDDSNNSLSKTIEIVNAPAGIVFDPDSSELEASYKSSGLLPLPDTTNSDYHIWQEVRLEGEAYVTKTFWAQLRTVLRTVPDPRIAYSDKPLQMESGFGIQTRLQTVLTSNYDHLEKLVGVQMAWVFNPESGYAQTGERSGVFDALEPMSALPGGMNTMWQYAVNPWSQTGSRLHYTPLWFPDGQYTILSQAFYAWSPAGQLYWYDAASVDILGDMYDRVTAIQGR